MYNIHIKYMSIIFAMLIIFRNESSMRRKVIKARQTEKFYVQKNLADSLFRSYTSLLCLLEVVFHLLFVTTSLCITQPDWV